MSGIVGCAHAFVRRPWWWLLHGTYWHRWECRLCNYRTRSYDGADGMALRPIHPHMSVAFPGFNTERRGEG
jgi:hypothetical protein